MVFPFYPSQLHKPWHHPCRLLFQHSCCRSWWRQRKPFTVDDIVKIHLPDGFKRRHRDEHAHEPTSGRRNACRVRRTYGIERYQLRRRVPCGLHLQLDRCDCLFRFSTQKGPNKNPRGRSQDQKSRRLHVHTGGRTGAKTMRRLDRTGCHGSLARSRTRRSKHWTFERCVWQRHRTASRRNQRTPGPSLSPFFCCNLLSFFHL
jgi:hypothetical protein